MRRTEARPNRAFSLQRELLRHSGYRERLPGSVLCLYGPLIAMLPLRGAWTLVRKSSPADLALTAVYDRSPSVRIARSVHILHHKLESLGARRNARQEKRWRLRVEARRRSLPRQINGK